MEKEHCVPCKRDMISFMEQELEGFRFNAPPEPIPPGYGYLPGGCDISISSYWFFRKNEGGAYDHLLIRRGFGDGRLFVSGKNFVSCQRYPFWNSCICTYKTGVKGELLATEYPKEDSYYDPCPWFEGDNTREGLLNALGKWKAYYDQNMVRQFELCHRRMKKEKLAMLVNRFVRACAGEWEAEAVEQLYGRIDELAGAYHDKYPGASGSGSDGTVGIGQFFYGQLPPLLNGWVEELLRLAEMAGVESSDPARLIQSVILDTLCILHDILKAARPELPRLSPRG